MKVMQRLLLILLVILLCSQHSFGNPAEIEKEEDEFLEYLITTSVKTNNENLLALVCKAFESLGWHEKFLNLFSHLQSEQNKYVLLDYSINSPSNKGLKDFERIEKQFYLLEDKSLLIKLYLDLIPKYFKIGAKSRVIETYEKCYREINLLKNEDEFEDKIFLSIDLSLVLHNCGLQNESDKILRKVNTIYEGIKDISLKIQINEFIIYGFIEINDEEKAGPYAAKVFDLLMSSVDIEKFTNLNILEAFISLGKYEYACELIKKTIKGKMRPDNIKEIYYFMSVSKLLTCNSLDETLLKKEQEIAGEAWIKLLIEAGEVNLAKEISEKPTDQNGNIQNRDAYLFYLGKKYLNESSGRILKFASLNLAYKIKDLNKKIELMTEIALYFRKKNENDTFLKIMNDITKFTEGKNVTFGYGKNDLALFFLKTGFPDKAMQLIETIEDKLSQASDLYEFGTYVLIHCDKRLAEKVLPRFGDDSIFKGLLLSKIASWYLIKGEHDMALRLFKKAFEIIKNNDEGFLPSLIDDYINARVYGRIIEKNESNE